MSRLLLAGGSVVHVDRIEPADVLIDDGVVAAVGPRLDAPDGARRSTSRASSWRPASSTSRSTAPSASTWPTSPSDCGRSGPPSAATASPASSRRSSPPRRARPSGRWPRWPIDPLASPGPSPWACTSRDRCSTRTVAAPTTHAAAAAVAGSWSRAGPGPTASPSSPSLPSCPAACAVVEQLVEARRRRLRRPHRGHRRRARSRRRGGAQLRHAPVQRHGPLRPPRSGTDRPGAGGRPAHRGAHRGRDPRPPDRGGGGLAGARPVAPQPRHRRGGRARSTSGPVPPRRPDGHARRRRRAARRRHAGRECARPRRGRAEPHRLHGVLAAESIATVTATPARVLGLPRKGSVAPGFDADLTLLTADLRVATTFVGGREVRPASEVAAWRS